MRVHLERAFRIFLVLALVPPMPGQDPGKWDDIHFEAGSSNLVDGLSELARVAKLLKEHPDYRAQLTGHSDSHEAKADWQKLSTARAETVKSHLVSLGAAAGQVDVRAVGASEQIAATPGNDARFQNRRVSIVVHDAQGKLVAAGETGDTFGAIMALQAQVRAQQQANQETMARLSMTENRLNDIMSQVRNTHAMINGMPKPPTTQQIQDAIRASALRPTAIAPETAPWWTGGLSGRAFLVGKETEDKKYGLYSYILIPRQPLAAEEDLKKKYVATLDAYQAMIDTVAALRNQPHPPALTQINITYLPLQFMPDKITSEKLLAANNCALAKTLIQLLKAKHPGLDAEDGPFIVSYVKPLIGADRVDEHLLIDMSRTPADAAALYVRAFLTQAGRERYWEKDRNQWVLDCYSFIENSGLEFAQVAQQYKDKSFLSTVFGWFK